MDENPYKSPHAPCNLPGDDDPPQRKFVDDLTPENFLLLAILGGAAWYSMDAFSVAVWTVIGFGLLRRIHRYFGYRVMERVGR